MNFATKTTIIGFLVGVVWVTLGFANLIGIALLSFIGYLIGRSRPQLNAVKRWFIQILDR